MGSFTHAARHCSAPGKFRQTQYVYEKRILADQITPKNVPAPIADKKNPMDSVKRDI